MKSTAGAKTSLLGVHSLLKSSMVLDQFRTAIQPLSVCLEDTNINYDSQLEQITMEEDRTVELESMCRRVLSCRLD